MYDPDQQLQFFDNLVDSTMKWMQTKDVSQWGSINCRMDWSLEYPEVKQTDNEDPITSDDSVTVHGLDPTPPTTSSHIVSCPPSVTLPKHPSTTGLDYKYEDPGHITNPHEFLLHRESKSTLPLPTLEPVQAPAVTPDNSSESEEEQVDDLDTDYEPNEHDSDTDESKDIENFTEISKKNMTFTPKASRKRHAPERGPFVQD